MTPLGAGAEGYPDWQRIANFDGPQLANVELVNHTGGEELLVQQVSRYASIAGYLVCEKSEASITFGWYGNQATTILLGLRRVYLTSLIAGAAFFRIPNLGPWLVTVISGTAPYSLTLKTFASNRTQVNEFTPIIPVVLTKTGTLAIKGSITLYPTTLASGAATLFVVGSALAGTVSLEAMQETGKWVTIGQFVLVAGTPIDEIVILPSTSWRVTLASTAAVETPYAVSVTPSPTGSS